MTPCPGTYQPVETTSLKGHTWKAGKLVNSLLRSSLGPPLKSPSLKAFRMEDPTCSPSLECAGTFPGSLLSSTCITFTFLSANLQAPPSFASVTCFLNPFVTRAHFFHLCNFLNKLLLIVGVLALNSFLATTQVLRLLK